MRKILLFILAAIIISTSLYFSRSQKEVVPAIDRQPIREEVSISILPETITQGEPVLITVNGVSASNIKSIKFNGKELDIFEYDRKPSALIGIDLRAKIGSYEIVLELEDEDLRRNLVVGERVIVKAPLGIPDKLGGDTPEAERELINTLAEEGAIISAVPTSAEKLWSEVFAWPLQEPLIVTDTYGYSRLTGASTISHKGTDFRAVIGTPVYAMNSGLVRFSRSLRNYGNTVIIDHGLGLQTIYMHLSKIDVAVGDMVGKSELIGQSGDTGYVLGPHLHITVRIGGISIDPEKFMALLGQK